MCKFVGEKTVFAPTKSFTFLTFLFSCCFGKFLPPTMQESVFSVTSANRFVCDRKTCLDAKSQKHRVENNGSSAFFFLQKCPENHLGPKQFGCCRLNISCSKMLQEGKNIQTQSWVKLESCVVSIWSILSLARGLQGDLVRTNHTLTAKRLWFNWSRVNACNYFHQNCQLKDNSLRLKYNAWDQPSHVKEGEMKALLRRMQTSSHQNTCTKKSRKNVICHLAFSSEQNTFKIKKQIETSPTRVSIFFVLKPSLAVCQTNVDSSQGRSRQWNSLPVMLHP